MGRIPFAVSGLTLPRTSSLAKAFVGSLLGAAFLLGATTSNAQLIFHKKKKVNKSTSADNNAQPDKILYDRAIDDIKHGRHEIGRLNMQTLINTYPDSEYLAKAKLAIADSYYKEGGTANLALAISGYKDFIVFFPFLPEATYAQIQVAMAHYRQMEKPDRDRTQALDAEEEFQTFLQKYPNDPLAPQALQHLREVQEVLAEGDYRIGYYYYVKGDKRAAAARLLTVTNRYPLYSKSDHALWMMGDIFEKSERKDVASLYYARIVKNYPLSPLVDPSKDRLKAFGTPIPQPDPNAVAWMTAEQNAPRPHTSLVKKPLSLVKNGPGTELKYAARNGAPNLTPESDSVSPGEILTPGGKTTLGGPGTGVVATVVPGSTADTGAAAEGVNSNGEANSTEAPKDPAGNAENSNAANPSSAVDNAAAAAAGAKPDAAKNPPAADPTNAATPRPDPANANSNATPAKPDSAAAADPNAKPDASAADPKADASTNSSNTDGAKPADAQSTDSSNNQDSKDKGKESSSKKKKGVRKLIPW